MSMAGLTYKVPATGEGMAVEAGLELGDIGTTWVAAGGVFPHPAMIKEKRDRIRKMRVIAIVIREIRASS